MKNILIRILLICVAAVWWVSCIDSDVKPTTLRNVTFPSLLTASTTNVVGSKETDSSTVLTISWDKVDFGGNPKIAYKLQVDVPSDTSTATPWSHATSFDIDSNVFSKSFYGYELSSMARDFGFSDTVCSTIVIRVLATADRKVSSNAVSVCLKPYFAGPLVTFPGGILFVPNSFQGFNPLTAPHLDSISDQLGGYFYEGYMYVTGPGTFKVTDAPSFSKNVYLDGGDAVANDVVTSGDVADGARALTTDASGTAMQFPEAGYYRIQVNTVKKLLNVAKTEWVVVGNAISGGTDAGWQPENVKPMVLNVDSLTWSVTLDLVAQDENGGQAGFKLRARNDGAFGGIHNYWWNVVGFNADSGLFEQGEDFPLGNYNSGPGNITVAENGSYTITLDKNTPGVPKVTITKNP